MYSLTVKELKDWINEIPAKMDMEQVAWVEYDGTKEPSLDVSLMFKKKLSKKI